MASGGTIADLIVGILNNAYLTTALTTVFISIIYWYFTIPKGIPPGPPVIPFLGYLSCIVDNPHLKFSQLAKKYGPVFRLYFGNRLVIVLNNYESIKEAFVNQGETFAGRPQVHLQIAETDRFNMLTHDNDVFKTHRRFALNVMRDCGVGKKSIEPQIMNEIQHFLSEVKKLNGETSDFSNVLTLSVGNNVCIPLYGKRFDYNDSWFLAAQHHVNEAVGAMSTVSIFNFFPWLNKLPKIDKILRRETLMQNKKNFKASQHIKIRERKKSYVEGQRGCYMDAFIGEQKAREHKNEKNHLFSDQALEENMSLLLIGGTETTANTLMWCILYMATYPEVQMKVQKEIDEVIGKERYSCYNDKLRTPYTEATILEVQRIETLVPMNIPHRNKKDCEIFGYKIPKDTLILANLWAVHNDVKLWTDPEVFRPERFLSSDGQFINKEYLIPFAIGKRECPGKILAVMELYLYFTSMLQAFTFKTSDGSKPSLEPKNGFTVGPKYFCMSAISRNIDLF